VHDGNLPGRAAEADEAQLEPVSEGLPERWVRRTRQILARSWCFSCVEIVIIQVLNM
jgi:hypothetical protein